MTISAGDGQLVSYGNWNGHLPGIVHYRLMSRTVQRIGEALPGPWKSGAVIFTRKGFLLFKGERYRKVRGLESSVAEYLPRNLPTSVSDH